ncbi:MAG: Siroheme synthase [Candidatus Argoarchaeum ethanivorans]|uniref:Siroheme synthase n=1 Tax=Candidatus Argoarchaeum ethanivorans TaxID=2608793 RepID=A0A811T568_9EURY|nr:MAG: Siroheme synthase [Candidatus Argoarchaeum ethanivorans]
MQSQNNNNNNSNNNKLYVVGIGPGSVQDMTIRAQKALESSEYILGNSTYLDQIAPLLDGKKVIRSYMGDEVKRAQKALELAESSIVSIISGGDANIYGMAGLVLEVAEKKEQTNIEIIPGVTAITASAACLGAPITADFAVISLSDLLTPWEIIKERLYAAARADFVIALYNPKSRKRTGHLKEAIQIISEEKKPQTPVGIAQNVTREGEHTIVTTLGEFMKFYDDVDMRTTILIGNRESRIWNNADRVITPRGYHKKYDY